MQKLEFQSIYSEF